MITAQKTLLHAFISLRYKISFLLELRRRDVVTSCAPLPSSVIKLKSKEKRESSKYCCDLQLDEGMGRISHIRAEILFDIEGQI